MEKSNPYPDEITAPGRYGRLQVLEGFVPLNPTPEQLTWPIVSLTTGQVVQSGAAGPQPTTPPEPTKESAD